MDPFDNIRSRYLTGGRPPITAAVDLTIDLAANRPGDGPEVRQGWPLTAAAGRAVEVIGTPGLDVDMVAALTAVRCQRLGLVLTDDRKEA